MTPSYRVHNTKGEKFAFRPDQNTKGGFKIPTGVSKYQIGGIKIPNRGYVSKYQVKVHNTKNFIWAGVQNTNDQNTNDLD